jgi:hypothetical protein
MGFKLIAQLTLITAALVLVFLYIRPTLGDIKEKQNELFEYNEAIAKASDFNALLQELIAERDKISETDLRALEKFVPTEIDQLRIMSEISGIFYTHAIQINKMTAHDEVLPQLNVELESDIIMDKSGSRDLSYQDFDVNFKGTYEQLRMVLAFTEASDSLLEVVELTFDEETEAAVDENGEAIAQVGDDEHNFQIVFRTYGLPIQANI